MWLEDNPNLYFIDKPYKAKYVCCACRKVFKRRELSDISKESDNTEKPAKCPDCGKQTHWIGRKFRAPHSDNVKAWKSIEVLLSIGDGRMIFQGSTSPIIIPESKKSLKELLLKMKMEYQCGIEKSVRSEKGAREQIKRLTEVISRIDIALNAL